MPRQNYNVTLKGPTSWEFSDGSPLAGPFTSIARRGSGKYTGTQRRKPVGFLSPTDYYMEEETTTYQHGTCDFNSLRPLTGMFGVIMRGIVGAPDGTGRFNGDGFFGEAFSADTIKERENDLRNQSLIAARINLKSSSVNLGIAFGERRATANLLGSTATSLATSVRALRRGETRNAMNALGISSRRREPRGANVPQKWLELQYGWKPLLSDVYGAARALEKRPKGDWRVTAKATRKVKIESNVRNTDEIFAHACSARGQLSCFTRIDALPQNEALISLASLGVTNPLLIGWELVPYSFVVDWVLPIGDYLESLDAMLGYSTAAYSSSYFGKVNWVDRGLRSPSGKTRNSFIGTKQVVYLNRVTSNSVPLPSLPRFKDPRSLGHMANGLALLATAFGRR